MRLRCDRRHGASLRRQIAERSSTARGRVRALSPEGSRAVTKILIVDDESSMRFLLRTTFELDGYEVDEAANGRAAAELLESNREYDLVSTDFMMPVMNGGELIDRIRQNPGDRGDPDHPHQLQPRLRAAHGSRRILPEAVRPEGAARNRQRADGEAMTTLTTGDSSPRRDSRRRRRGRLAARDRRAAGQRQDDPRAADVLRQRDGRAPGALLHHLVGAARQAGAAPRAVCVLRRRRARRARRVRPPGRPRRATAPRG